MITHPNVKVNIGLNVLRRRPDGFHDISSLFVPYFGLSDVLEITPAEEFSIRIFSSKPGIPDWDPNSDLCAKAWRLLRDRYGIPPVAISLEKRNPVGAGLGGGSSDAAFTLKMLSEMFALGLGEEELVTLAATLGSDCPFFIFNRPMFAEGRGERLTPFPLDSIDFGEGASTQIFPKGSRDKNAVSFGQPVEDTTPTPRKPYRLKVIPLDEHLSISTGKAYSLITPSVPEVSLQKALQNDISQWRDLVRNDFQPVIAAAHPLVEQTISACYENPLCVYAAMSGSGPSVFSIEKVSRLHF